MKKRVFHRGHTIENASGHPDDWKCIIGGQSVSSKLTLIKKSIDWWCETKTFMPPNKLVAGQNNPARLTQTKVEEYKGFKLMNDSGENNQWYVIIGCRLLKGTPAAIKQHLDIVIQKRQQLQAQNK